MSDLQNMPESYWKEKLTPEQYRICRLRGTERAFTGALYDNHQTGMYECVSCGRPLFSSDGIFDSRSGWLSFVCSSYVKIADLLYITSFFISRINVLHDYGTHNMH